ncbi:MAG: hypothetical protein HYW33_01065 [Candidatus Blackburnbacteria bacterium]|nr:hypothetical protein [Candidatus Blackburnbacteria bacterium]
MKMLEDTKIDVKLKLSALWITMLFVFAYVDIFTVYRADFVKEILSENISGMKVSQAFLMFTTVYILIPSLMVFLSLVLKPTINRWTNIVVALLYAVSILYFAISIPNPWIYYNFSGVIDVILLLLIVCFAWKWPVKRSTA